MAGLFEPTDVMTLQERKAAIDAGIMTPEDFRPAKTSAPPPSGYNPAPSTAAQDRAKSLGITVEELKKRQDAQLQELLRKRKGYAKGGRVNPMEHTFSSNQDRSIEQMQEDAKNALKRGASQWIPDIAGFPGDIADALAYAARKVARGQSEASVPSLGAGSALRRYANQLMGNAPQNSEPAYVSGEVDPREELARLANPLFFTNPKTLAKAVPMAGRGAAELIARAAQSESPLARMATAGFRPNYIVKERGGNWLNNSVEDSLRGLLRNGDNPQLRKAIRGTGVSPQDLEKGLINPGVMDDWIKGPLTKYIKRDMGAESDPIRKLADEGILHFTPQWVPAASINRDMAAARGFPASQMGKTQLAKDWEDLSDASILSMPIKAYQKEIGTRWERNPWMDKLPEDTRVHSLLGGAGNTGFEHLTDEVYNSLVNGEIDPESLKNGQFSVEAAVRHVANKNAQRAKEAEKETLESLKGNLSAKATKEYPDGYRWVELPDTTTPEGKKLCTSIGKAGGWCTQDDPAAQEYGSGANRLHVLLDKEGRPHAQVQVGRGPEDENVEYFLDDAMESLPNGGFDTSQYPTTPTSQELLGWISKNHPDKGYKKHAQELLTQYEAGKPRINQIKPIANSWESQMVKDRMSKDPEYRNKLTPMLQDFVKSGDWEDVYDLDNTGLYRTDAEFPKLQNAPPYVTMEEAKSLMEPKVVPDDTPVDWKPEFKEGGRVNFDDLDAFLRKTPA